MISKELLSEVLKREVVKVKGIEANTLIYGCKLHDGWYDEINIYELAHKCKEWAVSKGFIITTWQHDYFENKTYSGCYWTITLTEDFHRCPNCGANETEPEAIFKACEWILKDKR